MNSDKLLTIKNYKMFEDNGNILTRYVSLLYFYSLNINEGNIENNILDLEEIFHNLELVDSLQEERELVMSKEDFLQTFKLEIISAINFAFHMKDELNQTISPHIKKIKFENVTKFLQYVIMLACFEVKYLGIQLEIVVSEYLTILQIFNFSEKELGFVNKIIQIVTESEHAAKI